MTIHVCLYQDISYWTGVQHTYLVVICRSGRTSIEQINNAGGSPTFSFLKLSVSTTELPTSEIKRQLLKPFPQNLAALPRIESSPVCNHVASYALTHPCDWQRQPYQNEGHNSLQLVARSIKYRYRPN